MIKKKAVGLLGAGLLVCILSLFPASVQATLQFGGLVGWHSPNFGELKDYLDVANDFWEADLRFQGGTMHGAAVEYEITPNFKLRGEWKSFNTQASGRDGHGWTGYRAEYGLNVNAYTLWGIHTVTPEKPLSQYIGAGLGQFMTKFQWDETISIRGTPVWFTTGSETEGPIGFQVLAGIRFGTGILFLQGEAQYIFAKVRMEDFESIREYDGHRFNRITIDLSGLFLNVGAIIRF